MTDDFVWWRAALAGEKPQTHESPPECGYYRVRDRRGLNKAKAPIKRPFVACAIWRDESGELKAELAGTDTDPNLLWPYVAKYPITYEEYAYWHQNERFPEKAA